MLDLSFPSFCVKTHGKTWLFRGTCSLRDEMRRWRLIRLVEDLKLCTGEEITSSYDWLSRVHQCNIRIADRYGRTVGYSIHFFAPQQTLMKYEFLRGIPQSDFHFNLFSKNCKLIHSDCRGRIIMRERTLEHVVIFKLFIGWTNVHSEFQLFFFSAGVQTLGIQFRHSLKVGIISCYLSHVLNCCEMVRDSELHIVQCY